MRLSEKPGIFVAMRWIVLFLAASLYASPLTATETQYDGHWFDQSRPHAFDKNGRRILTDGRPDRPTLRADFKPVPPVAGREVLQAAGEMSEEEIEDREKNPHRYWDWDKTVLAAGAAFAAAALGFLLAGPMGAVIGFLGGLLLGALASNLKKPPGKPALAARSPGA